MKYIEKEQKDRLYNVLKKFTIVVLFGILYFVFVKITGIGIPCLIKLVTKKYCPGCGVSRMFIELAKFNIKGAFGYNALLVILMPFALVFGARKAYIYVKNGKTEGGNVEKILILVVFVITVAFWIMRNTQTFSCLAPTGL